MVGKLTESTSASSLASAASSAASAEASVVMVIVMIFSLDFFILGVLSCHNLFLLDACDDECRRVLRLGDLDERVVVNLSLLAGLTVVEVLAHRALVPDADDRV